MRRFRSGSSSEQCNTFSGCARDGCGQNHTGLSMSVPAVSPELPPRTWRLILRLLGRVPQAALSRAFGAVADVPLPPATRRLVLGAFARAVGIDLDEAELPLEEYPTLNAFFVRRLRPGARTWPTGGRVVASPVDGILGQLGTIHRGRLVQAKGRWYSAAELLGRAEDAERYQEGAFVTIYLSPRHYHRIHSPCGGEIPRARHVPGALLPVNEAAVAHIPDLFARNERLVCHLQWPLGSLAVVAVGAYNVGRITAAFDPAWNARHESGGGRPISATNRRHVPGVEHEYRPPVEVRMGDEIMTFHLGSTIVLLLDPAAPPLRADLRPGAPIRLGEPLTLRPE
jgi:phosphatidylserine decarboxylase